MNVSRFIWPWLLCEEWEYKPGVPVETGPTGTLIKQGHTFTFTFPNVKTQTEGGCVSWEQAALPTFFHHNRES